MAMYLFASRLSSAVCARRARDPSPARVPRGSAGGSGGSSPVAGLQCSDCSRLASPAPLSPLPTSANTLEAQVVVERTNPEPLQRNTVVRATVGPCDRSHRTGRSGDCGDSKGDRAAPTATKHRVRFANTFPRVNRRKRISESHEEGEIVLQDEEDEDSPAASRRNKELVFRDTNLVSGTLEALVQRLVPTSDYYPDRAFLFAFLLSSRLYIQPNQLLGQVAFLCRQPTAKDVSNNSLPRLIRLLADWMETFPYDFRDDRIMAHVRSIIQRCGDCGSDQVTAVLQTLLDRLTALERYEEFLQRVGQEDAEGSKGKSDLLDFCSKPEVLAQQLTIIELERLSYIGPEEFLQAFSSRESPREERPSSQAKNLEAYVAWSNRLTYLVATEIVRQTKKAKRIRVLELWITTAQNCLHHNNFNSLVAIISGLNLSAVSRLHKTWAKIDRQRFTCLEKQMDASGDFATYRSILKSAARKFIATSDQPCGTFIPYFSLFLKDVFTLQEECSKKLPSGHINFEKFWQMAKLVTELITWQQVSCSHVKQPALSLYLQAKQLFNETELLRASFLCEAPATIVEQEQWKSIKKQDEKRNAEKQHEE